MLLKKGSTGSLVKTMQQLLISIGINVVADGIFGSASEKAIKIFQEDSLFPINEQDGICGNKTWKCLIEASKKVSQNYKEFVVWVEPKQLKCALVNDNSTSLVRKYKNFVNGGFFWFNSNINKNATIGWCVSDGVYLQSNNITNTRGGVLVLKDGTVIIKPFTNAELMDYKKKDNIKFCIQGYIDPTKERLNAQEVGRLCLHPIIGYCSKTNKILIGVYKGTWHDANRFSNKYSLDSYCLLDGGGSVNMFVNGVVKFKTSRTLSNIIYW